MGKSAKYRTPLWTILLVIFCTILTSVGQLFMKLGANNLEFNIRSIIVNLPLIAGVIIYLVAAVLFIIALRRGELSTLYPFIALSFIWVALLSVYFLGEIITLFKIIGVAAILIGVSFIGKGANDDN